MSWNDEDKREGASRIFEALSGIDEELLEKCENISQADTRSKVIPFWKYTKAMVACVCVLLLGGLVLVMPRMAQKSANDADCARPEHVYEDGGRNELSGSAGMQEVVMDACTEAATEEDFAEENAEFDGVADKEMMSEKVDSDGLDMYIPEALPAGYKLERASTKEEDGTELFDEKTILWSRGLDVIRWKVKRVDASEIACVDITETEKYDVHLYEIPYADTVPENYREVFDEPVFRAEDINLAVIEKRMKTIRDAGDTDTPRGNFGVLFEDADILVEFSGRATAQEVWDMLRLLPTAGSTAGQD